MRNDWLRFSRNGYTSQHVCVCVEHMTSLETLFCILRWLSSQDVRWHFNTSLRLGTQKSVPIQIWIDTQKLHLKTTRPQDVPQRLKIACHPSRRPPVRSIAEHGILVWYLAVLWGCLYIISVICLSARHTHMQA